MDVHDTLSKFQLDTDSHLLKSINDEIKNQQKKLMEQTKISISEELKKVAEKIEKERSIRLANQDIYSVWKSLGQQGIRNQIVEQEKKVFEEIGKSLDNSLQEAARKNVKVVKEDNYYSSG